MSIQIKANDPLIRTPHFQNKMGGNSQHSQKSLITNDKVVSAKDIKTEDSLVRKYNEKATFFNKNIPQLKKHIKEEIYVKETIPLPLLGGSLPEIVPLHQLRYINPLVQNSKCKGPNVKVSNFPVAGRLEYFVKPEKINK